MCAVWTGGWGGGGGGEGKRREGSDVSHQIKNVVTLFSFLYVILFFRS